MRLKHRSLRFGVLPVLVALVLSALPGLRVRAAITTFTDQPSWSAAVGGPGGVTLFAFDGPTETNGRSATDPAISPSYSSQGVDFLPFLGTTIQPTIARNQQFQISHSTGDGLLANNSSPNPTSDLAGRAIRFTFNRPEKAVGFYFNGPFNDGDGGYLEAFDAVGGLIARTDVSAAGGFVGLLADQPISQVNIVNTFNSDIAFGIYNLQFSAVPEPASLLWLGVAALPALRARRRTVRARDLRR